MRATSWAVAAAIVSGAVTAQANPFFIGRYGGLREGPTDTGPFSLYWNPAGLAVPGGRVGLHLQGLMRHATYDRPAEANDVPPELEAVNAGKATASSGGVVPAITGGYGFEIADDFVLGLGAGFFVARAGVVAWDEDLAAPEQHPGAVDGPQRWAAINTSLLILSPSVGVGFAHRPTGLSVGLAPVFNIVSLSTVRARNPDRSERLFDQGGTLAEGRILLDDGEDFGVTLTAGMRWQPDDDLAFAFSWVGGRDYDLRGTGFVTFGVAPETTADARIPLQVPHTFRLGADVAATDWLVVRPLAEYSNWSVMDRQVVTNVDNGEALIIIERDFQDTLAAKVRFDFIVSDRWVLQLGGGYETGATPPQTHEPGLAEGDSWHAAAGFTVDLTEQLKLTASYWWHQFHEVEVTDSIQEPTVNGTYTDRRQYVTVDLEVSL